MVPKKSIFEKLGLIEPKITDTDEDQMEIETQTENIPDPDHVPDLRNLDFEEQKPKVEEMTKVKEEPISTPNEISDKLDLIIGAYEKNKMLTIDEIYRNAQLDSEVKKTIFMTDVYLKAIPENLPLDIKRETVLNIMKVSNIGLDDLLSDAYKRIDSLNTVLEETVATTQEVFDRNDATIRELEKRIEDLKDVNKNRKKFQEDQNTMIEYEIQKIINLVEFVKPKK